MRVRRLKETIRMINHQRLKEVARRRRCQWFKEAQRMIKLQVVGAAIESRKCLNHNRQQVLSNQLRVSLVKRGARNRVIARMRKRDRKQQHLPYSDCLGAVQGNRVTNLAVGQALLISGRLKQLRMIRNQKIKPIVYQPASKLVKITARPRLIPYLEVFQVWSERAANPGKHMHPKRTPRPKRITQIKAQAKTKPKPENNKIAHLLAELILCLIKVTLERIITKIRGATIKMRMLLNYQPILIIRITIHQMIKVISKISVQIMLVLKCL